MWGLTGCTHGMEGSRVERVYGVTHHVPPTVEGSWVKEGLWVPVAAHP